MTDWAIDLGTAFPLYSQNTSPTTDGQPNEDAADQCGPTDLAMIVDYLTGVQLYPDTIKDIILQEGATGVTSATQLTGFLRQFCSTDSTVYTPSSQSNLTYLIWKYLVVGKPLLVLQRFSTATPFLHWRVCVGLTPTIVTCADPWQGTLITQSYTACFSLFAGQLIGIERVRDTQLA